VIRQGPVPVWLHGTLEYVVGVGLIVVPFLLAFQSGAAKAVAIILGLFLLIVAATTTGSTSIINQVPVSVHILLDYALAGVMVASPFLFGFSDETSPTAFFIALGVAHLLVTIATRFVRDRPADARPAAARGDS
jgi:hypothetical protein